MNKQELHIKHLQEYLTICKDNNDTEGEGVAATALANAYQSNNMDKSIEFLEENIRLADATNQPFTKAESCGYLGVIYTKEGNYDKAVKCFEEYFRIAHQLNDMKMADQGRVLLGIARGNLRVNLMLHNKKEGAEKALQAIQELFSKSSLV